MKQLSNQQSKRNSNQSTGRGRPKGSTVREDILEKAGAAFVKHGFHACTVEDILSETGVSRTNFYRFFKNKESVFESIFQKKLENLTREMQVARQKVPDNLSVKARIEFLLQRYLEACFSVEDLLPIIIQESEALPQYRTIKKEVMAHFSEQITRSIQKAGIEKPDPLVVEGFMAAVDRIMLLESQQQHSKEKKVAHCKDVMLKFVDVFV